jgi:DNA ligase-1
MKQFRPMLASPADMSKLRFPLWLSPKLDGIRALVINGVVMSRSLKPIPNQHVQWLFGHLEGYDGELIVGSPTDKDCFRNTTSGVMSRDGKPDVNYHVFDRHDLTAITWEARYNSLRSTDNVHQVRHHAIHTLKDIEEYELLHLAQGYEGVMLRDPNGPYKNGRSTAKEGWLLKVKRFEDSEALVIGMEEKLHNGNEATVGELGQTKRTSHQENLVPLNTMGALIVRDLKTGVEFNIGTGFTDEERSWWWKTGLDGVIANSYVKNDGGIALELVGKDLIVKYKYFPSGSKDKPRFPSYQGIRHKEDM